MSAMEDGEFEGTQGWKNRESLYSNIYRRKYARVSQGLIKHTRVARKTRGQLSGNRNVCEISDRAICESTMPPSMIAIFF